jgi:hypothetical protein
MKGITDNYDDDTSEMVRAFTMQGKELDAAITAYGGPASTAEGYRRIVTCVTDAAAMIARYSTPPISTPPERLH